MLPTNRFLRYSDFDSVEDVFNVMDDIRFQFNYLYKEIYHGKPHTFGAKDPSKVTIHWSREWEYPWAVLNSDMKKGLKILDCGCGGSPLILYLAQVFECEAYGVDINYGSRLLSGPAVQYIDGAKRPLIDIRHFYVNPALLLKDRTVVVKKWDMADLGCFDDNSFDRVFCISTIEHLERDVAERSVKEMVRVLKPNGLLVITMDHNGIKKGQVLPWCEGQFQQIIDWSGLKLNGNSNFTVPSFDEIDGLYHVVGFVLKKGSKHE